jgi:hypothetical protein
VEAGCGRRVILHSMSDASREADPVTAIGEGPLGNAAKQRGGDAGALQSWCSTKRGQVSRLEQSTNENSQTIWVTRGSAAAPVVPTRGSAEGPGKRMQRVDEAV